MNQSQPSSVTQSERRQLVGFSAAAFTFAITSLFSLCLAGSNPSFMFLTATMAVASVICIGNMVAILAVEEGFPKMGTYAILFVAFAVMLVTLPESVHKAELIAASFIGIVVSLGFLFKEYIWGETK